MTLDAQFGRLLGTLYAAPAAPGLWHDFLEDVSSLTRAEKIGLLSHDLGGDRHNVVGRAGEGGKEAEELYQAHYGRYDGWFLYGQHLKQGRAYVGEEIWPSSEMLQSLYYNEFLNRFDMRHMATVTTLINATTMEHLTLCRGTKQGEFSREVLRTIEAIVPHLQMALATRRRLLDLESRVSGLENAFDRLDSALVLLDAEGQVVLVNRAASVILSKTEGLSLGKSKLMATGTAVSARLKALIAEAIATATGKGLHGGGALQIPRTGTRPLQLLISPIRIEEGALPGSAVAVVFFNDPDCIPAVPADVLRELFGLTFAEARLAQDLVAGKSLLEAAEQCRIKHETARTQVKSMFQKTGARRQSELLLLLTCACRLFSESEDC